MAHLLLLLLWAVPLLSALWPPSAGFLQVKMAGKTQTVFLNANVTIVCQVQTDCHLNIRAMGVTWFWKPPRSTTYIRVFQYFGDNKMITRPGASVPLSSLERGDASLQLPGIQLQEAGEYRCEVVVTPDKAVGTVQLEVVVSGLFPEHAIVKENEEQRILCNASGFFPITITWEKWTQKDPQYVEISEGVFTHSTTKNKDGMFRIISFLMLKPSLEDNMSTYQCVVQHKSLPTSQRLNFTLTVIESEKTDCTLKDVLFYIGIILVAVLIFCILWKRVQCRTNLRTPEVTEEGMRNYNEVLSL